MRAYVIGFAVVAFSPAGLAIAQSDAPLSAQQVSIACASSPTSAPPPSALRVAGGQDTDVRSLFGPGDLVVIDGGTAAGAGLDQRYFIRHAPAIGPFTLRGTVQTVGWLRIVAVNDATAIAAVDVACDGIVTGDYLEPFVAPEIVETPAAAATPGDTDFTSLGRIVSAAGDRQIAGPGDFLSIDRGVERGVAIGARYSIYRDPHGPGLPLVAVGEGVVVSAAQGASLLQVTSSRSEVASGDYVAPRR